MAICMVGRHYNAQYEWWAHRQMALKAGLPESVLDEIAVRRRPSLDDEGKAVYDFVSQLLETANVGDAAFSAVAERWGKRGAIDLVGTIGYYTLVSYVLNVDGYPLPSGVAALPD
jgi:4-carboxymuconolactone decarboxylase